MEQQTRIPPNQGCSRAKAKTPHFLILDLGGGEGYKFPIYFVQDCSLCNALIELKTRIALMAFSKKKSASNATPSDGREKIL